MNHEPSRVGFVSTRFAGTDGVSLETAKWVSILEKFDHESFFFAGESDWSDDHSYVAAEAHFKHPVVEELNIDLFDDYVRSPETSRGIYKVKEHLKAHLYKFMKRFQPDVMIVENALALPMNVPLGLALMELIVETSQITIAHHHDFYWERRRYAVSAAQDYLRAAFPPTLPTIRHVVINSIAAQNLALRAGVPSTLIPNVMDFDNPPPEPDGYADDLRETLGIAPDEYMILQPTRIVPRKRIEQAIELVRRIELPAALVISHAAGDEGTAYEAYLQNYAGFLGTRVIFANGRIDYYRGITDAGEKIYSLADAYQQADLVTYPSTIEGFGNAFLEAIYYQRPIILNIYEIFKTDILHKGFDVIGFENYIDEEIVQQVRDLLQNPEHVEEMVSHNYELGRHFFSYQTLERRLEALFDMCLLP